VGVVLLFVIGPVSEAVNKMGSEDEAEQSF